MRTVSDIMMPLLRLVLVAALIWGAAGCEEGPEANSQKQAGNVAPSIVPGVNLAGAAPGPQAASSVDPADALAPLLAAFAKAEGPEREPALQRLWMAAAETDVTDEVLAVLTEATQDENRAVARLAVLALNDLAALRVLREFERDTPKHAKPGKAIAGGGKPGDTSVVPSPLTGEIGAAESGPSVNEERTVFQVIPDDLPDRLLKETESEDRRRVLHQVALHRSPGAVDVLAESVRDEDLDNRRLAVRSLWMSAADGVDGDGQARRALEAALQDRDPETAALARQALEDLERLEAARTQPGVVAPASDAKVPDPLNMTPPAQTAPAESPDISQSLREQALYDPDPDRRYTAVQSIAKHRSETATEALINSTRDEDPGNRRRALQGLWFAAADGHDARGRALLAFEQALRDPDPDIASLARRALEDLERLKAKP